MKKLWMPIIAMLFLLSRPIFAATTETEIRGATGLTQVCIRVVLHAPDLTLSFDEKTLAKEIADMLRTRMPEISAGVDSVSCPDRLYILVNLLKNESAKGKFLGTAGNIEIALHRPVYLEDKTTRLPFATLWNRSVLFLNSPDDDLHQYVLEQMKKKIDEFSEVVAAAKRASGS